MLFIFTIEYPFDMNEFWERKMWWWLENNIEKVYYSDPKKRRIGSTTDISCFSLYPGKNLGAYGDAGIITTNNKFFYQKIRKIRNQKLTETDYYALADHTLTDGMKTYRKNLRDITDNYDSSKYDELLAKSVSFREMVNKTVSVFSSKTMNCPPCPCNTMAG